MPLVSDGQATVPGERQRGAGIVRAGSAAVVTAILGLTVVSAACSPVVTKHGQHLGQQDLAQISPGMTQDQVKLALGTPATTSTAGRGNAYYYISSTMSQSLFLSPTEIDRQVVAVYFTPNGTVERVANYGMKDGKVFDYISRTTPSANTNEEGLFKQVFRNLGQKQLGL